MSMSTRVTEYYDCFDVKTVLTYSDTPPTITAVQNTALPDTDNTFLNKTNNFRGFNNFAQDDRFNIMTGDNTNSGLLSSVHNQGSAFTPPSTSTRTDGVPLASDLITITGKNKAPQVVNNISIDEAGNILCYPPNISVPYWNRVIFKHFDYDINPSDDSLFSLIAAAHSNIISKTHYPYIQHQLTGDSSPVTSIPIPKDLWNKNNTDGSILNNDIFKQDFTGVYGETYKETNYEFDKLPVFIKYDMYPSRTKVVYSSADKWNQNSSDIVHNFNYHHGQMEPIKLNISLSASNPITDPNNSKNRYNQQLTYDDIQKLFKKCYWSIEWIYDRTTGN